MAEKRARIFGIIGGGLTLLLSMITMADFMYLIMRPISETHPESIALTLSLLPVSVIAVIISGAGFTGSFFVYKKPSLASAIMIICGGLMILVTPIELFGVSSMIKDATNALCLLEIPPVLLTVAGIMVFCLPKQRKTQQDEKQML